MEPGENKIEKTTESIRAQASEWVAKHDLGLDAVEQDAFLKWLSEDPRHSELFDEQIEMWQSFDMLEQWRPHHSDIPNPDLLAVDDSKKKVIHWPVYATVAVAAAIVLTLAGVMFWKQSPVELGQSPIEYLADGEVTKGFERHELMDGTRVQMNKGSQVSVHYDRHSRLVKLTSGQAHFDVEKDPERPFIVDVNGMQVRAIGTAFSVERDSSVVTVLVTEGHVQFSSDLDSSSSPRNQKDLPVYDLYAGQRTEFDVASVGSGAVIENVSLDEIENELAWKDRLIEFSGAPLSKVVYEFNLRNQTQIKIIDSDLRSRRITAAVRPDNVDGFIDLLAAALDIKARRVNDLEIYLYR